VLHTSPLLKSFHPSHLVTARKSEVACEALLSLLKQLSVHRT
jgi:hypothetical protein